MLKLNFIKKIKKYLSLLNFSHKYIYNIVKIDLSSDTIIFRVKNKAALVKYSFFEVINNENIISMLSPHEACWLGGYFKKNSLYNESDSKITKIRPTISINNDCKYSIIFQNRQGYLGYIDTETKNEFIAAPLNLAENKSIIAKFNSIEAFHIGIMAYSKNHLRSNEKPVLKLIK